MKTTTPATTARDLFALPTLRVAHNGYEVIAERAWSLHPGDSYLTIVLARSPEGRGSWGREFVTWGFNRQTGGYFEGHYFPETSAQGAAKDFESRGKRA